MRQRTLGSLTVSAVGLGCNTFGRDIGEDVARTLVAEALDSGITFFDTADIYGHGNSEGILGRALGSSRDDVVVATKFGNSAEGIPGGARPDYIFRAVERSLSELRRDWIDLYQLHVPDPDTPMSETMGAIRELVDAGKIRTFGVSNFTPEQTREAARAGRDAGVPVVGIQIEYSAVNREPESSGLVDVCLEEGISLLPYRPMAKGLLTGRMQRGDEPVRQLAKERFHRFLTEENFALVDRIRGFAERHGHRPSDVAILWLLNRPGVSSVFPGATRPEQVRWNADAGSWDPSRDVLDELDELVG